MSKLRLIGAVGIKVRPDASGFKRELDEDLRKLPDKVNIDVKLDLNDAEAKRKIKTFKEQNDGDTIKVKVSADYDSIQAARAKIQNALKHLDVKEIPVKLNEEGLRKAQAKLDRMRRSAKVSMEITQDEAGYRSVLNKIQTIRAQKAAVTVEFKTDNKSMAKAETEAKAALAKIEANKTVTIQYSKNYDGIKSAIDDIDKRLEELRNLKLVTKLDRKSLEEAKAKLLGQLSEAPVTVKFNEDKAGYEKVLSRIREIQLRKLEKSVTFKTDDESLNKVAEDMRSKIRALDPLRTNNQLVFSAQLSRLSIDETEHEARKLRDKIDDMKASMKVEVQGSALTAAHLAYLGRDRVVNYIARVNTAALATAEGMLKSIGGINTLSSLGNMLESIFTKFDQFSLKAGAVSTALGSIADVGVYAGTAIFRVGEGIAQSAGLLAAAPAMFTALAASLFIYTAAFDNFGGAFSKDLKKQSEALAKLPPNARAAVDSLRGLMDQMQRPVQDNFWAQMGTSLQDSVKNVFPVIQEGLAESAKGVGKFTAGMLDSFREMSLSGDLKTMFGNLTGFFDNLSGASKPFFDGFNQFGLKGSELLPRFGQWLTDLSVRFDKWATKSAEAGKITEWIDHGVNSLGEMWKAGGDVVDMFRAVTRAAGLAGAGGLADFQIHLRDIADQMLGEPWQSRAATIFEGARKGAAGINVGFKDLTGTLGNASVWLGTILTQLGDIGGGALTGLSNLLGRQTYQDGITASLTGLKTLVDNLGPSFSSLGDVIGNMSKVAGSVFGNMAPVINQITGLLDSVTTKLSDNLSKVAPKMIATVGGVFSAITPMVLGLTDLVNGFLGVLSGIPNSFVTMGVAASAFFALRGLASKFFDSFRQTDAFKTMEGNWLAQQAAAGKTVEKYRLVNGELEKYTVPTGKFSATSALLGNIGSAAGGVRDQLRTLNDTAKLEGVDNLGTRLMNLGTVAAPMAGKALGGLMSALGGPWGLAIGGASILIGAFAQSQQDAKKHVDDLTASIDKQTGKLNQSGLEKIAQSWTDLKDAGDGGANFMRGVVNNTKAANETAKALKLNFADVTKAISNGGPAYDQMHDKIQNLASAMQNWENRSGSLTNTKEKADAAAAAFGLTAEQLSKMGIHAKDIQHLSDNIAQEAASAQLAKSVFEGLATATGTSTIQAQQMAAAMQTIGDNSIDASGKIGAINKALDLLKGGTLSARDAEVRSQQASQNAVAQAQAIHDELAGNNHLIDQTNGLIDVTSASGLKLQTAMSSSADGIKTAAYAAYKAATDAGKTPTEAMAKAQEIINKGQGELEKIAKAAGVPVEKLQKEWEGFFGQKWEMTAVFSASADRFEAVRKQVTDSGLTWNDKVFTAFLAANKDPAAISIDEAKRWATDYANGQYQAQLTAINPDALQKILDATGQATNYKNGDYTAVMKALDSTNPGVQAALSALLGVKNGDYSAAIRAFLDAVSAARTADGLDAIAAKKRTAQIMVEYFGQNEPPASIARPKAADGALLQTVSRYRDLLSGKFAMKAFANGGIENHVAQIARPSSVYRVWAEPETGGEAYIPLAATKRERSTAILNQVASQFGYKLTKAQAFEDGGVVAGGNSRTAGVQVHIDTFNQNANDSIEDVGRGIFRQARNSGMAGVTEGL